VGVDWLLAGHVTSTTAVRSPEWTTGGRAGEGGCRSGAKRDRQRQRRRRWIGLGLGFGLGIGGVKGATLHIRSVVSAGEQPRPAPFAPLKADTTGLIKTPTNK